MPGARGPWSSRTAAGPKGSPGRGSHAAAASADVGGRGYAQGMARPISTFRCTECGWTTAKWAGRCAECQQWGTVVDVAEQTGIVRSLQAVVPTAARAARPIGEVEMEHTAHRPSGHVRKRVWQLR